MEGRSDREGATGKERPGDVVVARPIQDRLLLPRDAEITNSSSGLLVEAIILLVVSTVAVLFCYDRAEL